ncbi:MAG: DNA repair protein RadC [Erysipelotrichaceae bacterium]
MKVKELPTYEKPREKALKYGINVLSNNELLALLIRCGTKDLSSIDLATSLLAKYGSLRQLLSLSIEQLIQEKGIKEAKGLEIKAVLELALRASYEEVLMTDIITSPKTLINYLQLHYGSCLEERFIVVYLNTKNYVIKSEVISIGDINSTLAHPREIFKKAMMLNSCKIICAHNHVTGDITPSNADIQLTKDILKAGFFIHIPLVDHLIISCNNYFSFAQNNMLKL